MIPHGPAHPLCHYDARPCPRRGVYVLGPPVVLSPGTVNRSVTCLTCGVTGDHATSTPGGRHAADP